MKRALMMMGIAYTGICIGACIWVITKPESYGKWMSRMINGVSSGFEEEEI